MTTILLKNKYKVENLNEGVSLAEAIDGIAYTATIKLVETKELKNIGLVKGDSIIIYDTSFETKKDICIFQGVVWSVDKSISVATHVTLECKERTVYLEESEDEYLFPAGQTATQRIQKYCKDWGIPTASLVNTKTKLDKAVYRKETILSMMLKDLKETAQKSSNLYKLRMLDKLNIIGLGSNKTVWKLETIAEDIDTKSSLNGAITQVKVLGKQDDKKKSPVIGTFKSGTEKYGTLQKIVQDEKIKNSKDGKGRANKLFNFGEESVRISGIDINTIRAGDKVSYNGVILYVIDVTHNLGSPGKMTLNLTSLDQIYRRFYDGDNF